ncbi:hypothetical protein [Helicobacter sp.]|uniref:hypothetical protein n=1 Tax=Helicobacter sp. TaxID=218 RepID=UPI0025B99D9E|nr:hypothetical protein [Helicobacter sp.]MBR2493933.1 hypothetical protein [Helicobacter sp.]
MYANNLATKWHSIAYHSRIKPSRIYLTKISRLESTELDSSSIARCGAKYA